MNTQIIAIANQKGGVGKTTTCANLGIGLAQAGKKVLLIDGDPQGSLTISLGNPQPDKLPFTLSDAMGKILMDQPIRTGEGILHHAEGVDLMPADIQLSGMEVSLVNAMSRETILRQYLDTLKGQYSHILIDCQPSLGMLTVNALAAANRIIIPVQAEYLPAKGLEQLLSTVNKVKRQINPKLQIDGILLTIDYYRTRVQNADGKLVALYARTPEELYDKELGALEQIDNDTFCRKSPTVADYCEKWLLMQSVHVRATTLIDYTSKVRRHIIKELGQMRMADVTLDDIQLALVPVSEKSASVYKSVVILYKSIFRAAKESKIIDNNPTIYLTAKGGGVPQKDKAALTDEQAARLLDAIQGLPPYVFVMLGLYAGLRREEILALKWDSVYLDVDCPYLTVRRAWHTENNRPVILDELKTKAAHRNIPLPVCLADCLKETKANSQSEYVVPNREGDPLSYTQFKRLWQYIVTRTVKERFYYRYEDGKRVKHTVTPVLGEKAAHNGKVIYSLDFEVTPHQLRHTYITNLIHSSVDPKTVQYLAGHESSKITMDIYAKVKYNRPDELVRTMGGAFAQWDAAQASQL